MTVPIGLVLLGCLVPANLHAQAIQANFVMKAEPAEVSAISNGAALLPTVNTAGIAGKLVLKGTGSVNFTPGAVTDSVYFLRCCDNTAVSYYKFTGTGVGELFNVNQGRVSFYLKSRYSFSARKTSAASPRYVFDVRDNNPDNHIFYFATQVSAGFLMFSYSVGGGTQFYYVPTGTEDTLFGNGVVMKVAIEWDGAVRKLYINDALVQSTSYAKPSPSWTATSNFNIGSYEYSTIGGFNACDDAIDEFTVSGPVIVPDTVPPLVTITAPASGSSVNGAVSLSANASDAKGMNGVQFQLGGVNIGGLVSGAGPTYTTTWDTTVASNGSHTLTAIARDLAGNTSTTSIPVIVANQLAIGTRVFVSAASTVYSAASTASTPAGTQQMGSLGTIAAGPVSSGGVTWWQVQFDTAPSGWLTEAVLRRLQPLSIPANAWKVVQPAFTGAPDGGQLYPQGWANKGTYDPRTHRVIFSDRWFDPVRGGSIFANGIHAYHPATNVFTTLKLNNWYMKQLANGGYETAPLPQNTTDPTPPDHHPLTALELVPEQNAVYYVNGVNSISLPDLSILNTTWRLDLGTNTWTKVSDAKTDANYPPNNGGSPSGVIYDPVSKRLVHFVPTACGCNGTATYLFDPVTARWTALPRDASSLAVYVAGAGVALDPKRNRILAYGGTNYVSNIASAGTSKLWAYSVADNRWTQLADGPVPAMAPGFAYDSKHDVFLALAGNVTYIYNPVTNSWSNYGATITRPPTLPNYQAVVYNQAYDVFVFQGGSFDAPLFAMFRYDPNAPPPGNIDVTAPTVSLTTPANSATLNGAVTVSATASDNVRVSGVQFTLNGVNLGSIVTGTGPTYSITWNTLQYADGPYTLAAVARDTSGNNAASAISVTVGNTLGPPVISSVTAGSITSSSATINWTTNEAATSQVNYGTTTAYGSSSTVSSTLRTSHSVLLSGLLPSTTYHYRVVSRDVQGEVTTSGDFTFTTAAGAVLPTLLRLAADASEVSGVTNGSTVTPTTRPPNFTGTVSLKGTGSVNFTPAQNGDGVYFLKCCDNTAAAYYRFTGSMVGNIFNINQGQISFYLKSRYSFAQRQVSAAASRYVFDVHDQDANNHVFYFRTQASSGRLMFAYSVSGGPQFHYIPEGAEEGMFGNGVVLKITIVWDGVSSKLYLNDVLVQSANYTKPSPNWTANSVFAFGGYDYLTYGAYNTSDDTVDEFTVRGPTIVIDTTAPAVSMTAPAGGATVMNAVTVSANATDNVGIASVQFKLDGDDLGAPATGAGPSYSRSWDTTTATNGPHTLTAVARDAAGNATTATSITVTVNNPPIAPVITSVAANSNTFSSATIAWTTDRLSDSQVLYGATTAYGSTSQVNSALLTAHSITLTGLTASTTYHYKVVSRTPQGGVASSSDFIFTTPANPFGSTLMRIAADASEVTGVTNGSVITPTLGPAGFTGNVIVKSGGSVNFIPGQSGNGVYFLNCCDNTSSAYYRFMGSMVGNIFNVNRGQISFSLKSRYSFAQRQTSATASRFVFDVRDNDPNSHLFYFRTQVSSGRLLLAYAVGGGAQFYYLPQGAEETMFGSGVILNVTIAWNGTVSNLYLNDVLVHSANYIKPSPSWTANSVFALGAYDYLTYGGFNALDDIVDEFAVAGPPIIIDTTVPSVSVTAPAAGGTVSGAVNVSAAATDNVGVAGVQFQLDGVDLGAFVPGAGPSFSRSWDTTNATNGSHTLTAIARDTAGNVNTASITVNVNNPAVPPVITSVSATSNTFSSATITWTTDRLSDSQVRYGTTAAYGSTSPVNSALVTSHSIVLTGLAASTTYHYQVVSRTPQGGTSSSGDFSFTTPANPFGAPVLRIAADASEVTGVSDGATVTPAVRPAGFTGAVVVKGSGSVNFAPAQSGNGVYFLNCCDNTGSAYYRFMGSMVGNIFNVNRGQISFSLKSRYSFAQRQTSATASRFVFDVRDNDSNNHPFYFRTQVSAGRLLIAYAVGGAAQFYYVPQGSEDTLFGNGVILNVTITWNGTTSQLYLNDVVVQSASYTKSTPNWTANSVFAFGGYDYLTYGGFNTLDDIIDEFTVLGGN